MPLHLIAMSQSKPTEPTEPRATAADIDQEAADWVARQDRGPLSDEDQAELERWAASDARRAGAYARALAVNLHLDRVVALGDDFAAAPPTVETPSRRKVLAAAASAVFAVTTGLGIFAANRRSASSIGRSIATPKGAVRQLALQEGSHITLNTLTQITPAMSESLRRVDLLTGEALFDVAKDPTRPFIVYAGDMSVRAVGTSFSVRRIGEDEIRVLVTEGVVEVARNDEILGRVHAGIAFSVNATSTPVITNLAPSQVHGALAWRQGRLDLEGMTLADAVAEFSRYSDLKIEVSDPSIANLHITGVYATNDPAGFAENAALSLGLSSVRKGNVVTISRN
ncbi:DUF4880 domain-containing protein [Sphingomonas crocodyli]|uniref:DUF4880 domain-containing protein n=2 Tax=Sphingomonas crocodyli TaxID=1979270 RepID=A0A437M7H6_9SPHN|nr:DUF4880 domain-containing protein [Sphingomonas crocodyli]